MKKPSRIKASERAERRIQMFIDRGIYKTKTEVLEAAMTALVRNQMEADSKRQAEEVVVDDEIRGLQLKVQNA